MTDICSSCQAKLSRRRFAGFGLGLVSVLGAGSGLGLSGAVTSGVMTGATVEAKVFARRYKGKKAPKLRVGTWVRNKVPLRGKPMLIKFFATWCSVCRRSITPMNKLQKEFGGKLRVVAIANAEVEAVKNFMNPRVKFSVCTDKEGRTFKKYGLKGTFPHFVFVSKKGYVRFEGPLPVHDYKKLKKRIARYV